MQLLIVHRDAEVGEQLVRMVKDYTAHDCALVTSDAAAVEWARAQKRCALLLTQLEAEGIDGLALGGSLSEIFPGLQTMFLPGYPASDQRLDVTNTKVFPEPIDGERLLNAISRAVAARVAGFDLFHVIDVLQMCCLSRRSGAVQLVKGASTAIAFLQNGEIVHAECGTAHDQEALVQLGGWDATEFAYDHTVRPPAYTMRTPWDEALIAAVVRHKEEKAAASARTGSGNSEAPQPAIPAPAPAKRSLFSALRKAR